MRTWEALPEKQGFRRAGRGAHCYLDRGTPAQKGLTPGPWGEAGGWEGGVGSWVPTRLAVMLLFRASTASMRLLRCSWVSSSCSRSRSRTLGRVMPTRATVL